MSTCIRQAGTVTSSEVRRGWLRAWWRLGWWQFLVEYLYAIYYLFYVALSPSSSPRLRLSSGLWQLKAWLELLVSPSPSKPSPSQGFQAEPGPNITTLLYYSQFGLSVSHHPFTCFWLLPEQPILCYDFSLDLYLYSHAQPSAVNTQSAKPYSYSSTCTIWPMPFLLDSYLYSHAQPSAVNTQSAKPYSYSSTCTIWPMPFPIGLYNSCLLTTYDSSIPI